VEVITVKPIYILLSFHQSTGQNHDIKFAKRLFENLAEFRYFGMIVTNQNTIQDEIRRRLNCGNACSNSVQTPLSSHLLSRNINIRICKIIILLLILYICETLSLILRKEHGLRCLRTGCWGDYLD
jgi:hypothetical protein